MSYASDSRVSDYFGCSNHDSIELCLAERQILAFILYTYNLSSFVLLSA